jgi:predicted  nucleic acid-binding Zn-ribbon protein
MKKILMKNLARLAAAGAAMAFAAGVMPFIAHAQSGSAEPFEAEAQSQPAPSKYANDTFTLISRSDGSSVDMHVDGQGDHCWASTSDDKGIGISMGDSKCTLWDRGVDDEAAMHVTLKPDKISFRLDGKSYSISDAATVKQARSLFDPLVSIEEQQSELGAKQRALGDKQRDLGEQQREVKVQIPDMSADFQKVEADAKRLSHEGGTQSELGDLQSELGDLQSRLGDLQSQAGDAQSQLGDKQSALGDQQSAFGDQQSKLGDESEHLAEGIASKLRVVLNQSIQNGTAKSE